AFRRAGIAAASGAQPPGAGAPGLPFADHSLIGRKSFDRPSAHARNRGHRISWITIFRHAAMGMAISRPKTPNRAPPAREAKRIAGVDMSVLLPWMAGVS